MASDNASIMLSIFIMNYLNMSLSESRTSVTRRRASYSFEVESLSSSSHWSYFLLRLLYISLIKISRPSD